ncbi:MAG: hypothetical protein WC813_04235 [Patescibacteria group bacterium]|jgi:hypothetical protein
MSVRVYLDPKKCVLHTNPHGARYILVDGAKQYVQEEGGLIFFSTELLAPMNPSLRKDIVSVTYQTVIEDVTHMARIARGRYAHGKFGALVRQTIRNGRQTLDISVKAPTLQSLSRWLHPLLAGQDTPIELYSAAPQSQAVIEA